MPVIKQKKAMNPTKLITLSFLLVIVTGTVLLMLPISSRSRTFTNPIDALFTATSATCVTGLNVFDTYTQWNLFGQIVILLLLQIGGLGLVTFTSFFTFATGKKVGLRTMQTASESVNSSGFSDVRQLVRSVMIISAVCEGIGALLLMIYFVPNTAGKAFSWRYSTLFRHSRTAASTLWALKLRGQALQALPVSRL